MGSSRKWGRALEFAAGLIVLVAAAGVFFLLCRRELSKPNIVPRDLPTVAEPEPDPIVPEEVPMAKLVTEWAAPPDPDCRGIYYCEGTYNGRPYWSAMIGGTTYSIWYDDGPDWWYISDDAPGLPAMHAWYCASADATGNGDYSPTVGVNGYPRVEGFSAPPDLPAFPSSIIAAPRDSRLFIGVTTYGGLNPSDWPPEETITVDKWYQPLAEPVRVVPQPVRTGRQFLGAEPTDWPAEETITVDKWFVPLAEPVRTVPQPVRTGRQFLGADPTLWPAGETVTVDKWYQPLAEPVRTIAPHPEGFAILPLDQIVDPDPYLSEWFIQLSRPVWPTAVYSVIPPLVEPTGFLERFYVDLRGLFRIFNAAEYWLYRSSTAPPAESDTPFAKASTLPATPPDTYADGTWYLSAAWFNGVLSSGFGPVGPHGETYLRLDLSSGAQVGSPPIGPLDWGLEARAGGVVRVHGVIYLLGQTADPDQWAIGYTTDGSTPAEDSPAVTVDLDPIGGQFLVYDLPAQDHGTTVKVRLQTRRNDGTEASPVWVYSDGSTVRSITADAAGPSTPLDLETWPGPLANDE